MVFHFISFSHPEGLRSYRQIPKISPWAYIFQRNLFEGLYLEQKHKKSKDYCKADLKQRILFFITIFGWLYQPSSGLQMLLNLCSNHNII